MKRYLPATKRFAAIVLGSGLLVTACYEDPGVIAGELSSANQFRYVCDDSAAVESCTGTTATVFPTAVAKGALFRLSIDASSAREVDELRPISDEVVGTDASGAWLCGTEGLAGFVAFDRAGSVVDYVHVKVETPLSLRIDSYRSFGDGFDRASGRRLTNASVREGETVTVSVAPVGKSGIPLAGALPFVWTTSTDGVVRIKSNGTPTSPSAFATIAAVKSGQTRIRVEGAGLSTEFEVTVP